MTREEAINIVRNIYQTDAEKEALQALIPELKDSEDERIIRFFAELATDACGGPGQEYYEEFGLNYDKVMTWLKKQKEKPIKVEVYEVGKGTTVCGQDYRCKKDYKEGSCWYIKDVLYHCSRDGYLTDQNGVSWSCTPEWFNEYIYTNNELAEKEKNDFVSGQFLQCKRSFDGFKEGEHYWLEYIGDDMYVGRSDNILNQKFHITPRQLYTLFSQQLDEVQGPPQEEKQVSLNYEPPFNENPSDKEIIEALIKHLKEQDGFLTAIDCVSTKAILSWLEKQKEQDKCPEYCVRSHCIGCSIYEKRKEQKPINQCNTHEPTLDEARKWNEAYEKGYSLGYENGRNEQKPAEWDKLQEDFRNINEAFENGKKEVVDNSEKYGLCRPAERSEEDERIRKHIVKFIDEQYPTHGNLKYEKDKMLTYLGKQKEEKSVDMLTKDQYVEKFRSLCDSYEIKLPNRAYDIYHLCTDLAELFGNSNKQE